MSNSISNEMINAYIDNELDEKERLLIDESLQSDQQLRAKIEQLKSLKLNIKNSYSSVSSPLDKPNSLTLKNHTFPKTLAASIALFFGLVTGWYSHDYINLSTANSQYLLGVKLEALKPQDNKIIIHLSKNDLVLFDNALTKAETLLAYFNTIKQQGKVHILANSYGMDILRSDTTPYQERISKIMNKYNNVEFVACENTIKRLKSSGKEINLLPGVKVHGPVINQIISRLQNGWTYINI